eukprot:TRINITY_DN34100_c0_g1_i2.p1 TRINITY_DN34100_c0_g1~~TRINITY_DN34100_c0_g1_i2.p1  ORF type:complete len:273 (+),score=56.20 TRINITY_DN34100_c0_g1_i2:74-820(+)
MWPRRRYLRCIPAAAPRVGAARRPPVAAWAARACASGRLPPPAADWRRALSLAAVECTPAASELSALRWYCSPLHAGHRSINAALRQGRAAGARADALDLLLRRCGEAVRARGAANPGVLTLFRGIGGTAALGFADAAPGDVLRDPAFLSCAATEPEALLHACREAAAEGQPSLLVVLRLVVAATADLAYVPALGCGTEGEEELLLSRDVPLTVIAVEPKVPHGVHELLRLRATALDAADAMPYCAAP